MEWLGSIAWDGYPEGTVIIISNGETMSISEQVKRTHVKLGKLIYRLYREGILDENQVREFEAIETDLRIDIMVGVESLERNEEQ